MALEGSIARRYARALHQLGVEQGNLEALFGEVSSVAKTLDESKELADTLGSPMFTVTDRKGVLGSVAERLGVSKQVQHFLFLLLDRNRLQNLSAIVRELGALVDAQAGRVRAEVTSAAPLTDAYLTTLTRMLEERLGKRVIVEQRQDAALLGGVKAKVGDVVFDGSLRTQLDELSRDLMN